MIRNFYAILLAAVLPMAAYGQKVINVATAGTLPTLISEAEKYSITDLTLTGELNGTDLRLLRDMAGNNWKGELTEGKLSKLNLTDARIVAGGEKVVDTDQINYDIEGIWKDAISFSTEDDVFPPYAFMGCNSLEEISLPAGITKIGKCAFAVSMITKVSVPATVQAIDQQAFYNCDRLTEFDMPDAVTTIGQYALAYCTHITKVKIPAGVTEIGKNAFNGCTRLAEIRSYMNEPCAITNKTFAVYDTATLYVPKGTKAVYQNTDVWSQFVKIEEFTPETAITTLKSENFFDVYNLQGRMILRQAASLDALPRGIYIINGKKVLR